MDVEITPEPDPDEREAIVRALADVAEAEVEPPSAWGHGDPLGDPD